jgi:arabinofuranosyltransferase
MQSAAQPKPNQPILVQLQIKDPWRFILIATLAMLVMILVFNLWVADDAFITMRTVDNFWHGHGLVWNIGERVQVYTHPLWMFVLLVFKFFIKDALEVFYIPSFFLSVAVIFLVLTRFARGPRSVILAGLAMGGSMAFIDFSSSGLENPLTNFLIVLYLLVLFREGLSDQRKLTYVSLLSCLAALNRLDTLVIFLPALLYQIHLNRPGWWRAIGIVLLCFLPFILWELFATFYYGFPFPNTFYAKAQTGFSIYQRFSQGWAYHKNSFHLDPLTLGTILLGLVTVALHFESRRVVIALGIILYQLYICWIGGDFMSGRFFSGIFLMGLVLLLTYDSERTFGWLPPKVFYLILTLVLLTGLSADRPPVFMTPQRPGVPDDEYGIALEKYYYFWDTCFINHLKSPLASTLALDGLEVRRSNIKSVETNVIGIYGYYAGPETYIIDTYALADPLRAHLPTTGGRIGHYERPYPAGYVETIESGFRENLIIDPRLQFYYAKLSILTRGDLFAPGRLREIVRFNFGFYDPLIEDYLASPSTS